MGVAAIPFAGLLYGMVRGKYAFQIHRAEISSKRLPSAFDGFTIAHLSDIHIGSFAAPNEVKGAIDKVLSEKPDLILFTGDLVNNKSDELDGWQEILGKLKAPYGVYSVLGNHDYGDYAQWDSASAKAYNLQSLKDRQKNMGWNLLLNQSAQITKDGSTINLAGVENWGAGRFAKYGDLEKALNQAVPDLFTILMSHDPSHWDAQVRPHKQTVDLTLSGHTHGMQMGIEIPGWLRWSPSQYIYKQWAGLYRDDEDQHLYVNRGFGHLGYPGRVGIWPEITMIKLQKA
jgi:predicted MPP superfamily phosphohydrolase